MLMTAKGESLEDWLALGETCRGYHDGCLAMAQQQGLAKLAFVYQFAALGTQTDRRAITGPADASATQSILERLGWEQTMSELKGPYSSSY